MAATRDENLTEKQRKVGLWCGVDEASDSGGCGCDLSPVVSRGRLEAESRGSVGV